MTEYTINRRQFLRSTTRIGITLALAASLPPPARTATAQVIPHISVPHGTDILNDLDVQDWIASGVGALWAAGHFLNKFARNLDFENLPEGLKQKYQFAGAEYKSMPLAKAIWETIPAPVRAGGPEALEKFHKGKDWSHIIPKAWGGPTTAENGIWWCSPCNKKLGANPMSKIDLLHARALLLFEGMRFGIIQSVKGMVRGGMVGVVVGGLLTCLECGLEYAEGKISWEAMLNKIVETIIVAGAIGFTITGLIVGISLAFPFLIPIATPLLVVLQVAGFVFLGKQVITLARGWWHVLDIDEGLNTFGEVLENVGSKLRSLLGDANENLLIVAWEWLNKMADRFGIDKAWELAGDLIQQLGIERALVWFASQTRAVTGMTADLTSALRSWNYLPDVKENANDIRESVASVVTSEFQEAISTTEGLLASMNDYRKRSNLNANSSFLAA